MRDEMEMLQSLNLKEVWIKAWRNDTGDAQYGGVHNENRSRIVLLSELKE